MSHPALPAPASRLLNLPHAIRALLPDACTEKLDWLRGLMVKLDAIKTAKGRGMLGEYFRMAGGSLRKISGDRLKKYHWAWTHEGITALIDHRLCEGKCEQPGCDNRGRQSMLHPATIDAWVVLAQQHRANGRNSLKSRSYTTAWRALMAKLINGEMIPGVAGGLPGTWQDIYRRLHPAQPMPAVCPWSTAVPPHGWGKNNFLQHKKQRPKIEDVLARDGISKALEMLPQVRFDYSEVRPLEYLLIDDKRMDVKVWMEVEGVEQIVELWALFIMDLCSRRIAWVQLVPKVLLADGKTAGISRRDVQHSLAHVFRLFGTPKHYDCTIVCENASAAITTECEELLTRVFDGRVKVNRTGLWDGATMVGGFIERGGKPRDKAPLESYFGHRWDVEFGKVRGQIGGNYMQKPGDEDGRALEAKRALRAFDQVRALGGTVTDEARAAIIPYESLASIKPLIMQTLHAIETRTDHKLQGFQLLRRWRYAVADPEWKAMNHPAFVAMETGLQNSILAQAGCVEKRMESPVEKWQRLWSAEDFEKVDSKAFIDLWMDSFAADYLGNNQIKVTVPKDRREFEFRGTKHSLMHGEEVRVRFDLDAPEEGAWIMSASGSCKGRMEWCGRTLYGNEEDNRKALGQREQTLRESLRNVRKLHQSAEAIEERNQELDRSEAAVSTMMGSRAGSTASAPATSAALVAAMLEDEEDEAPATSSQRYLKRGQA